MFRLKDGSRTVTFSGEFLAESSSREPDSLRWSEFKLYKTQSNTYILQRIGDSRVYHTVWCRKGLEPVPRETIQDGTMVPCSKCHPDLDSDSLVCPESRRVKVIMTPSAEGLVKVLYMKDANDVFYLTNVARELLELASEKDNDIKKAYMEEYLA
jgi:hypothetical protein